MLGSAPAPVAEAALPPGCEQPAGNIACLQFFVGDFRTTATGTAPLEGAVYGLFATQPGATLTEADGFVVPTLDNPMLFRCVSDAEGDCVFEVPIREGASSTDGVREGTRLWLAPLADNASADFPYYGNPFWQTGTVVSHR